MHGNIIPLTATHSGSTESPHLEKNLYLSAPCTVYCYVPLHSPNMNFRIVITLWLFLIQSSAFPQAKAVDEGRYVSIGGIDQWITIRGSDLTKPMILFLHGGPGSVMSPYDAIYRDWQKDFVLVNWDQRGAGRTFGRNAPDAVDEDYWIENPLTLEQMTADGIALAEYLLDAFGKEKIILIGTSWGSVPGVNMALRHPDLFYAYIGHSQFVSASAGLQQAYAQVTEMASRAGDKASQDRLKSIGAPPYDDARKVGQLIRVIKKYEAANAAPAPESWWRLSKEYNNETDSLDRANGDDYSFIHYAGHKALGIKPMSADIDFMSGGLNFKIPVYLIQGEHDILTPKVITERYFRKINAPEKKLIVVPDAAHGHNLSVVEAQHNVLMKYVLPLIEQR